METNTSVFYPFDGGQIWAPSPVQQAAVFSVGGWMEDRSVPILAVDSFDLRIKARRQLLPIFAYIYDEPISMRQKRESMA